jgi:flavin-binding protein dodecin
MSTVKIIELVGCSSTGFQDAVESAVKEASKTLRHLRGVDIVGYTGKIKDGKIVEYRADVKISFVVEESEKKTII